MKNKILLVSIVTIISAGFFCLGWYAHRLPVASNVPASDGPYFSEGTPYLHLAYGDVGQPDSCPPTDTSDDYVCIYKLSHATLDKADALAQKLMKAPAASSTEQFAGFYEDLRTKVRTAQKVRDAYFDGICDIDELYIYGGSGMGLEREACRYYYASQYLGVLQKLESKIKP